MWVKICGIRSIDDARMVAESRPDAIGLNFYSKSVRSVEPDLAAEIISQLPSEIEPVGLFVNHSIEDVLRIAESCELKTIQLHGDESIELMQEVKHLNIIRALRVNEQTIESEFTVIDRIREAGIDLKAVLVDARIEGHYGGSGQTAPWKLVHDHYKFDQWPKLVLAGGLNVSNIRTAIESVGPWGVDVASGAESEPGVKSAELVKRFVNLARNPV